MILYRMYLVPMKTDVSVFNWGLYVTCKSQETYYFKVTPVASQGHPQCTFPRCLICMCPCFPLDKDIVAVCRFHTLQCCAVLFLGHSIFSFFLSFCQTSNSLSLNINEVLNFEQCTPHIKSLLLYCKWLRAAYF